MASTSSAWNGMNKPMSTLPQTVTIKRTTCRLQPSVNQPQTNHTLRNRCCCSEQLRLVDCKYSPTDHHTVSHGCQLHDRKCSNATRHRYRMAFEHTTISWVQRDVCSRICRQPLHTERAQVSRMAKGRCFMTILSSSSSSASKRPGKRTKNETGGR